MIAISQEELKNEQYQKLESHLYSHRSDYLGSWSKKIKDDEGTMFSIKFDFFKAETGKKNSPQIWQAEANFKMGENDLIPVQCLQTRQQTIKDIEIFFKNVFSNIGAEHIERNNSVKFKMK